MLFRPAARRALRQRMLHVRAGGLDQVRALTGATEAELRTFRRELADSRLPDILAERGAGTAFADELPQGPLLYLLTRALQPDVVVETGVRPGYSTTWFLGALEANGRGRLISLGPGPTVGRARGVHEVQVGQFVPPALRTRWTLALGNTEEHVSGILADARPVDLYFYDNGPDADRARFELRSAWTALSRRGVLLAHHIDANPAWPEFCRAQGSPASLLDAGPPPLGGLAVRASPSAR